MVRVCTVHGVKNTSLHEITGHAECRRASRWSPISHWTHMHSLIQQLSRKVAPHSLLKWVRVGLYCAHRCEICVHTCM